MEGAPKCLAEILKVSAAFLTAKGVQEPRLAAEWLAARLLKCKRLDLHAHGADILPEPLLDAMRRGVKRVAAGEPVQYVLGRWEFRGLPFIVDRRALIPRSETEELVQLVLDAKDLWQSPDARTVDIGTGSGCIAIAIAKERPLAKLLAIDPCEEALELARENAALNKVAERIVFAPQELSELLEPATADIIVSNPPYIPSAVVDALAPSVRDYEPRLALDGGPDGMAFLRSIAEEAALVLRNGGGLFLELSAEQNQARAMTRHLSELGFDRIATHRDTSGAERFISARLAEGL